MNFNLILFAALSGISAGHVFASDGFKERLELLQECSAAVTKMRVDDIKYTDAATAKIWLQNDIDRCVDLRLDEIKNIVAAGGSCTARAQFMNAMGNSSVSFTDYLADFKEPLLIFGENHEHFTLQKQLKIFSEIKSALPNWDCLMLEYDARTAQPFIDACLEGTCPESVLIQEGPHRFASPVINDSNHIVAQTKYAKRNGIKVFAIDDRTRSTGSPDREASMAHFINEKITNGTCKKVVFSVGKNHIIDLGQNNQSFFIAMLNTYGITHRRINVLETEPIQPKDDWYPNIGAWDWKWWPLCKAEAQPQFAPKNDQLIPHVRSTNGPMITFTSMRDGSIRRWTEFDASLFIE